MGIGKTLRNAFIGLVLFIVIATAPGKVNGVRDWIMGSAAHLGNSAVKNMPPPASQRGTAAVQGRLVKSKKHSKKHKATHHTLPVIRPTSKKR